VDGAYAAASSAPPVVIDDPAGQHHPIRLEALTGHHQAELVEASEGRQISAIEGSVKHVEVSRVGSVRTSILRETSTPTQRPTRRPDLHPQL
jgi:hypothetical protein